MDFNEKRWQKVVTALANDPQLTSDEEIEAIIRTIGEARDDIRSDYEIASLAMGGQDMKFYVSADGLNGGIRELKSPVVRTVMRNALHNCIVELLREKSEWNKELITAFGLMGKEL